MMGKLHSHYFFYRKYLFAARLAKVENCFL